MCVELRRMFVVETHRVGHGLGHALHQLRKRSAATPSGLSRVRGSAAPPSPPDSVLRLARASKADCTSHLPKRIRVECGVQWHSLPLNTAMSLTLRELARQLQRVLFKRAWKLD